MENHRQTHRRTCAHAGIDIQIRIHALAQMHTKASAQTYEDDMHKHTYTPHTHRHRQTHTHTHSHTHTHVHQDIYQNTQKWQKLVCGCEELGLTHLACSVRMIECEGVAYHADEHARMIGEEGRARIMCRMQTTT